MGEKKPVIAVPIGDPAGCEVRAVFRAEVKNENKELYREEKRGCFQPLFYIQM